MRVLAAGDALLIGVRADDPEPHRITSFSRQRDASLDNEDHIRVVLDTYLDGRSGYVFIVNPNAARYDALITNRVRSEQRLVRCVEAATARTLRVVRRDPDPAKSLLFRRGLTQWGFNIQRRIQRLQETDRWASPDRDVKINMTSRAGILTDVPPFDLGVGLSVRPSVTTSAGKPAPGAAVLNENDVSLDVTQRLGANTLGSLTLNTDFAETEVDTRRTNLTRFPLSSGEAHLFLEGSDVFEFGLGPVTTCDRSSSRRIGCSAAAKFPRRRTQSQRSGRRNQLRRVLVVRNR